MKSILLPGLCVFFCSLTPDLHAQVPLPYNSGFDTPDERVGWTIYRLGEAALGNWSLATINGFSAPACVAHDYSPSTGVNVVDDWYVSPGFLLSAGGTLDSVRYAFSGFSVPTTGDTIGVYLILGDQDPEEASTILELADFRDTEYQADNVYRLLSGIVLPATNEQAFIGLRYRNAEASSRWLTVRFDNIAVSEITTSVNTPVTRNPIVIYPNPTADQVTILHKESDGIGFLYDYKGVLLEQFTLNHGQTTTTLSMGCWPAGIYQLVLKRGDEMELVAVAKN